jgi:prepilin-type N-terminal cleavage/methylation domain-containing protein
MTIRSAKREGGFTLIELLIAMTITLLIAGALAGIAQPARAAFDRVPAELELQQRGRTAIDAFSQALRSSVSMPGESGTFEELTVVVPVHAGAQGLLSLDQPGPGAAITLGTDQCPNIKDVCGFTPGAAVLISDTSGNLEVFSIASVDAGARRLTPARALSRAFPSGSTLVEVDQFTFGLSEQADGSYSLIRETIAGAIQPIVDFVSELSFEVIGHDIGISLNVEPRSESLRALMTGRIFRSSITLRNAP